MKLRMNRRETTDENLLSVSVDYSDRLDEDWEEKGQVHSQNGIHGKKKMCPPSYVCSTTIEWGRSIMESGHQLDVNNRISFKYISNRNSL